ncbi:MAG: TIGR01777 family protein [Ignavibacteria bacterium]|nr:TIGR01777 family protein [Ignavibacteria bacterium]
MKKKILITGGTGLIGRKIVNELCIQGAFVKILTRNVKKARVLFSNSYALEFLDSKKYDDPLILKSVIEETDAVINLAGMNVGDRRWNEAFKEEIYSSRINTTKLLVDSIKLSQNKPDSFISASGVGVYGDKKDERINEDSLTGNDFLADVCVDWENEALKAADLGVRVVILRTGIVLDKNDGALPELIMPFKFYIGAYQGNGRQWFSWIHKDDIVQIYLLALENTKIEGIVNAVSPDPVTNKSFIKSVSEFKKTLFQIPVPAFVMKIVAGEFAWNLLTGQKVFPDKLVREGYNFKFPDLNSALSDLFSK